MASILLKNIQKSFGTTTVLHGIDLSIADGEFTVFVGPSGCGKSTLLRLICGLDEVSGGTIAIDNEIVNTVPPAKRGIAMVFQSYALYPHMSVADNMGYALRLAGTDKAEIALRVRAAADVLRLTPLLDRKPRQLSGGQRQRVAIGRAIRPASPDFPVRRAALQSRRLAAGRYAGGNRHAEGAARHHHGLCHP